MSSVAVLDTLTKAFAPAVLDTIRAETPMHRRGILRDADVEEIDEQSEQPINELEVLRIADGNLLQARIDYLLASMPSKTAQAYRLSTELHRDPEAIAAALGVTKDTARWHVWEAKKRLRAALTKDGYLAGDDAREPGEKS